jgi:hypothetical protein
MNYIPLLCANESSIKIAYNPYEHYRTKHKHPAPLFERSCHQRGYCYLTHWNQWPINRYFHQAPWWETILWTPKWTKHHWFSECGLGYCYLTRWNQWPIHWYSHQAPWWEMILWTLKWTKHLIWRLIYMLLCQKIPIYAQNYPCFMIFSISSYICFDF